RDAPVRARQRPGGRRGGIPGEGRGRGDDEGEDGEYGRERRHGTGPGGPGDYAPRRRGSSVSRRASPSRFEPNTASEMATPGNSTRCGAFCAYSAAETESMR